MTDENNNRMITVALIVVILIAAVTLLYINLPEENSNSEDQTSNNIPEDTTVIFSLIYEDTTLEYTLSELEDLEEYTGSGSYIKTKLLPDTVLINGPWDFVGVRISKLLDQISSIPENYNITFTASDGWTSEYTKNQVLGEIDLYNESGNVTGNEGATMILAYKQDGDYIPEGEDEAGPLRVAFIGGDIITGSNLWAKMVISMQIVEV